MQACHQKCCHIKLWRIIKVSRAFNIIWILFYCGLYTNTIAIDVVTWRIIKKWCIWSLHLRIFLWLPIIALFLQKLCRLLQNYSNFIYIFLKFKLGTAKCIRLKWVFLPQSSHGVALQWRQSSSLLNLNCPLYN